MSSAAAMVAREEGIDAEDVDYSPIYDIKYDRNGIPKDIKINYKLIVDWLKSNGFRRFDLGDTYFTIRLKDNVIMEYDENGVIDAYENYLQDFDNWLPDQVQKDVLINKLYGGIGRYFSKKILHRATSDKPLKIQNHTKESGYFYYRNGFVEVTADGAEFRPYSKLEGVIWGNQILNRDYTPVSKDKYENCNYAKFVQNISNAWKKRFHDGKINKTPDYERYEKFKAIIGYGLHSFFAGKLQAVIFTDARISDAADGRTGKTLILKAMGHMLNAHKHATTYVELNGKDFDTSDRFKYQTLMLDTRLVHINDAKRGLDIEDFFNDITEGIVCQKKNEKPFTIPAKVFLSTNKLIKIHGGSAKDRCIEFELADYYCAGNGPGDEFGEWFFRDWSTEDWNNFDNFMISCVQTYLKNGLQEANAINLLTRKMIEETAPEFVSFMKERNIKHGVNQNKTDLYQTFIHAYPDFNVDWFKQRKLTKWLHLYAEYHPDIKKIEETRSNSKDYFCFVYDTAQIETGVDI